MRAFGNLTLFTMCLLFLGVIQLHAGPTDEELGDLIKPLSKEIQIQFLETPIERAMDYLQRESGMTFVIENTGVGVVKLEARKMSIRKALDWTCRLTGTDWYVEDGIVVIDSKASIYQKRSVARFYDMSSSTKDLFHYQGHLAPGIYSGKEANSNIDVPSIDSGEGDYVDVETVIEDTSSFISENVGDFDEWTRNGGDLSSMRRFNNGMIIKTLPRNHEAIARLLYAMESFKYRMIQVDARVFLLSTRDLDELIAENQGSTLFERDAFKRLKASLEKNQTIKPISSSRIVAFNGYEMAFESVRDTRFISELSAGEMASIHAVVGSLRDGFSFRVDPTMTMDQKSVILGVSMFGHLAGGLRKHELPVGIRSRMPRLVGKASFKGKSQGEISRPVSSGKKKETKAVNDEVDLAHQGKLNLNASLSGLGDSRHALAESEIELPTQNQIVLRATGRVPDQGAILVSMGASHFGNDASKEVILLVSPKILSTHQGEKAVSGK